MYHGNECTLTKKELTALLTFMSKDETRPNLCCLVFQPKQGYVVATDGWTLLRVEGPEGEGEQVMLGYSILARFARMMRESDELQVKMPVFKNPLKDKLPSKLKVVLCSTRGGSGRFPKFVDPIMHASVARHDAKVPDFEMVLGGMKTPRRKKKMDSFEPATGRYGLRASFLTRLHALERAAGRQGVECYLPRTELDPSTFIVRKGWDHGETLFRAVIMPMRI